MNTVLNTARTFINSANVKPVVTDVDLDIKQNRARIAIETGNEDLIVEWLVAYCPERLVTLATLKKFGKAAVLQQSKWAIACEADLQDKIKEMI